MTKLFIIAGHGAGDPGACANGYQEAECVRRVAQRIKDLGTSSVTLGDFNRNYYADGGINNLGISKETEVLELHLDSAAVSAKGGHVIIKQGFEPDRFDIALANWVEGCFPGRSQTIVKRDDLANPNRAALIGQPYRLLEICFISNANDIRKLMNDLDSVAIGILSAFGISTSVSTPAAQIQTSATPPKILYRVRISWGNDKSQIGAFESLDNARRAATNANPYKVFDENGMQV